MTSSEHFLDLAISVGDYVASKAERVEAGSRWSTLSYFGTPEYSPEVFSGVAGIVFSWPISAVSPVAKPTSTSPVTALVG